jgi:hypothetical protein
MNGLSVSVPGPEDVYYKLWYRGLRSVAVSEGGGGGGGEGEGGKSFKEVPWGGGGWGPTGIV